MDRFVTYKLAGERSSEYRALIHPDDRMWPPAEVSILTPLGISLLGLKVGDRVPLPGLRDNRGRWMEVEGTGPREAGGSARYLLTQTAILTLERAQPR
jgi:regulator of nucleoside diphosphate kinase